MRRRPDVLWRVAGATVVLLPPEAEVPLLLDGSGATLWEVLAEPVGVDEIVDALVRRYGIAGDDLREDVDRALTEMSGHGLIEDRS